MKKFLTKIMFTAVAVLSVAGFTSCNNADDPYVPEAANAQEQQDKSSAVPAYGVVLSDGILDMYDVKIVLHSGDKTKEVVPTKANAQAQEKRDAQTTIYKYFYLDVDGRQGVNCAEAKFTPKANIKTTLASMSDEEHVLIYGGDMVKVVIDETGKPVSELGYYITQHGLHYFPSKMLLEEDGITNYDYYGGVFERVISTK